MQVTDKPVRREGGPEREKKREVKFDLCPKRNLINRYSAPVDEGIIPLLFFCFFFSVVLNYLVFMRKDVRAQEMRKKWIRIFDDTLELNVEKKQTEHFKIFSTKNGKIQGAAENVLRVFLGCKMGTH